MTKEGFASQSFFYISVNMKQCYFDSIRSDVYILS